MALRDIIGQDRAINILLKTVQRGRLPSSYLFAGESGIGKKLAAINLAKAINCLTASNRDAEDIDACDECPSCRKIDSGIHPDFLLVAPEGGLIRIEEIRAIDDLLSLKAFEATYKVVVVDDADMMNQSAANAFLKTLEEPPENNLIILISSNPDRLPDTIRSRCSRINFTPLALEACEEIIKKVFSQQAEDKVQRSGKREEVKKRRSEKGPKTTALPDSRTLSLLVRLSMGRPGNVIAGDLIEEREWFMKLFKDMLDGEKDGWTSKEEMEKWFDLFLILLRDMAVLKITRNERDLINIDIKERLNKLSSSMDITVIIDNYQQLNALKGYFNFHLNKSLTWNYTGSLLRKAMGDAYA